MSNNGMNDVNDLELIKDVFQNIYEDYFTALAILYKQFDFFDGLSNLHYPIIENTHFLRLKISELSSEEYAMSVVKKTIEKDIVLNIGGEDFPTFTN